MVRKTLSRYLKKSLSSKSDVRVFDGKPFEWRNHEKLKKDAQRQAGAAKDGRWKQARVRPAPKGGYDVFVRGRKR